MAQGRNQVEAQASARRGEAAQYGEQMRRQQIDLGRSNLAANFEIGLGRSYRTEILGEEMGNVRYYRAK